MKLGPKTIIPWCVLYSAVQCAWYDLRGKVLSLCVCPSHAWDQGISAGSRWERRGAGGVRQSAKESRWVSLLNLADASLHFALRYIYIAWLEGLLSLSWFIVLKRGCGVGQRRVNIFSFSRSSLFPVAHLWLWRGVVSLGWIVEHTTWSLRWVLIWLNLSTSGPVCPLALGSHLCTFDWLASCVCVFMYVCLIISIQYTHPPFTSTVDPIIFRGSTSCKTQPLFVKMNWFDKWCGGTQ